MYKVRNCSLFVAVKYGTIYSTHATVRGFHRRQEFCGPFVLAKCCHDLDLISYWMGDKKCTSLSAFGHLSHFTKAHKVILKHTKNSKIHAL